ncbi:hypothetical protein Tco_0512108 [Tanacetum coccineum]
MLARITKMMLTLEDGNMDPVMLNATTLLAIQNLSKDFVFIFHEETNTEHPSKTNVFTMKMEILLSKSKQLYLGSFKDGDGR